MVSMTRFDRNMRRNGSKTRSAGPSTVVFGEAAEGKPSERNVPHGLLPGSGDAPDFDHPLEMLSACHDRIEDRCELVHRLVAHLDDTGCDDQARQAATSALRYFDTAGQHHHEDEEEDLFPALLATGHPAAVPLVAKLRAEHAVMGRAWEHLRVALATVAAGTARVLDAGEVEGFTKLYRDHIAHEEESLLPLALDVLDERAVRAIGTSMADRRGVSR